MKRQGDTDENSIKEIVKNFRIDLWLDRYLCGGTALQAARDVSRTDLFLYRLNKSHTHPVTPILDFEIARFQGAKEEFCRCSEFTLDNILMCHKALVSGTEFAGKLRTRQNWIGGTKKDNAVYVCPAPEDVKSLLSSLLNEIRTKKVNNTQDAVKYYAKFLLIHPFLDGNGRVARVLLDYFLREINQPVHFSIFRLNNDVRQYQSAVMSFAYNNELAVEQIYWQRMAKWLANYQDDANKNATMLEHALANKFLFLSLGATELQFLALLLRQPFVSMNFVSRELNVSRDLSLGLINRFSNAGMLGVFNQENRYEKVFVCETTLAFLTALDTQVFERKNDEN
jgi:Fic family protein